MNHVLINAPLRIVWPTIAVTSVYVLLKGHNEPGGGFIGGLMLALALVLRDMSRMHRGKSFLASYFHELTGVSVAIFAGIPLAPLLFDQGVFTGVWTDFFVPIAGKFSSVLVFDTLIYIIVAMFCLHAWRSFDGEASGGEL